MTRWCQLLMVALGAALFMAPNGAWAQGKVGDLAADFPPGVFTTGANLRLSDFEGKVVVLFFYEQLCPKCRELIPERNKVVTKFADKPVVFIAIAAGDTLREAQAYQRSTNLAMPVFADSLSLMEKQYGTSISLQNIYQLRVIDPTGKIVGYSMEPDAIERALAEVKWKYKDQGYHEQLNPAIELLEWNQWETGMKALKPSLVSRNPAVKESAEKLMEKLLAEAEVWKTRAEMARESNPVEAFELYTRISVVAANHDLGNQAKEILRELRRNKQVIDEMAARKSLAQLATMMSTTPKDRAGPVAAACQAIIEKYPDTPTAKSLQSLLQLASSKTQATGL